MGGHVVVLLPPPIATVLMFLLARWASFRALVVRTCGIADRTVFACLSRLSRLSRQPGSQCPKLASF
ncbi:hypothetical protein PG990_011644 [Apiospora arundinis]